MLALGRISAAETTPARRRGRPRRTQASQPAAAHTVSSDSETDTAAAGSGSGGGSGGSGQEQEVDSGTESDVSVEQIVAWRPAPVPAIEGDAAAAAVGMHACT
jgi:hypothetical protein